MLHDRSWMITLIIASTITLMAVATPLNALEDHEEDVNDDFEKSICPVMLKKPIAQLLVSEYNRITSTNQWLYTISRGPYVTCKDNDFTDCFMYIEISPTTCPPQSSSRNCPTSKDNHKKTCIAAIDMIEAEPRENLQCSADESDTSPVELTPLNAMKILKKQWGFKGGNVYPI